MRKYIIYILLLLTQFVSAQKHIITSVKFNKNSVYVGQAMEVTLSVHSTTWFTKGIDAGNIKVNGAFSVYFRSVSNSKIINGKTYSGVDMLYYIIPFNDKDITFPSITIDVESPDEGDYVGKRHSVKTKERIIKVRPIPRGFNKDEWLVTPSLSVRNKWYGNIKNVKVGDVLERRIYRNVSNTVSELIPPIAWDSIANVSLYPSKNSVKNNKTKTSISASRVDRVQYLFEKEGEVIIPEMIFTYWNPYHNKLYKRKLKAITINVLANPNLGMLESIRDSLNTSLNPINNDIAKKEKFNFMGLSLKQLIYYSAALIVFIYVLYKFMRWLFVSKMIIQKIKEKRRIYLKSEKHLFRLLLIGIIIQSKETQIRLLYKWIDSLKLKEPSIAYFNSIYANGNFKVENIVNLKAKINIFDLIKARRKYILKKTNTYKNSNWINP